VAPLRHAWCDAEVVGELVDGCAVGGMLLREYAGGMVPGVRVGPAWRRLADDVDDVWYSFVSGDAAADVLVGGEPTVDVAEFA
jgi:hypothetical protein